MSKFFSPTISSDFYSLKTVGEDTQIHQEKVIPTLEDSTVTLCFNSPLSLPNIVTFQATHAGRVLL